MSRTRMHVWTSFSGLGMGPTLCDSRGGYAPWHFLNFLPDPHQHGSLRPICSTAATRRCSTTGAGSASAYSSPPPAAASVSALGCAVPTLPEYETRPALVDEPEGVYCCAGASPFSPSISTSTWKI